MNSGLVGQRDTAINSGFVGKQDTITNDGYVYKRDIAISSGIVRKGDTAINCGFVCKRARNSASPNLFRSEVIKYKLLELDSSVISARTSAKERPSGELLDSFWSAAGTSSDSWSAWLRFGGYAREGSGAPDVPHGADWHTTEASELPAGLW